MKYIALLRGINVGVLRRVEMKKLRAVFESLKYKNVSTYINSGNVIFESDKNLKNIKQEIKTSLKTTFGFDIPALIKTEKEIQKIAESIPKEWKNDSIQRSDVAYLFDTIDSDKILDELPFNNEYIDIRYTNGAIYWNIDRKNYNKSHLNKLITHSLYQMMTVRNINTARFLAGLKSF